MQADRGQVNESAEISAALAADETIEKAARKVRGRKAKTSDHQEAIIKLDELHPLAIESMKAWAEKAGLQSSVLRKFIAARAGENFPDKKRDAMQLSLLFEEIGE